MADLDRDKVIEEGWPSNTWMAYMKQYIRGLTSKDFVNMSRAETFCIEYYFLIAKYEALEETFGEEMWKNPNAPEESDEWALPSDSDA